MKMRMRRIAYTLALSGVLLRPVSVGAQDQCIRTFSPDAPEGVVITLGDAKMQAYDEGLRNNNRLNPRVYSVAIFRDDTGGKVQYKVLGGAGKPLYVGPDIGEMADQIDAASAANAAAVYISLAGFSPLKGHAMRSDMNMQWARIDAQSTLLVRVPEPGQAGLDLALPAEFLTQTEKIQVQTKIERVEHGGKPGWYRLAVDFFVKVKSGTRRLTVFFLVRAKQSAEQLNRVVHSLHPGWAAAHISAAEVVSQVVAELKKRNPTMTPDELKVQIHDQFGQNRFVDVRDHTGVRDARS